MPRPTPARALLFTSALTFTFGFGLVGCPRSPPVPDPLPPKPVSPPGPQIPPGCEANLSGEYAYDNHPDWRYLAVDDGQTLALTLRRQRPDGGPLDPPQDPPSDGGVAILLERTPRGFVGGVEYSTFGGAGERCPVRFGTEVLGCGDDGLRLVSVDAIALDAACQPLQPDGGVYRREHRLIPLGRPTTTGATPQASEPAASAEGGMGVDGGAAQPQDGTGPLFDAGR